MNIAVPQEVLDQLFEIVKVQAKEKQAKVKQKKLKEN